jgi:hypothetical protein
MKVIEITKKTNSNVDQMVMIISILCLVNDIHLSDTEVNVLAFFVVYGLKDSTDNLLISTETVKNMDSLRNVKSRLTKLGFLKRTKELYKTYELNMDKDFRYENQWNLLIKIDNT